MLEVVGKQFHSNAYPSMWKSIILYMIKLKQECPRVSILLIFFLPKQVLDSKSMSSFGFIENPTIFFLSILSFYMENIEAWQLLAYTKGHVDKSYQAVGKECLSMWQPLRKDTLPGRSLPPTPKGMLTKVTRWRARNSYPCPNHVENNCISSYYLDTTYSFQGFHSIH